MMNELKKTSDKVKAAIALLLVAIILSGCDGREYYVTKKRMVEAELICANSGGLNYVISERTHTEADGDYWKFHYDVRGVCGNKVEFKYYTTEKQER